MPPIRYKTYKLGLRDACLSEYVFDQLNYTVSNAHTLRDHVHRLAGGALLMAVEQDRPQPNLFDDKEWECLFQAVAQNNVQPRHLVAYNAYRAMLFEAGRVDGDYDFGRLSNLYNTCMAKEAVKDTKLLVVSNYKTHVLSFVRQQFGPSIDALPAGPVKKLLKRCIHAVVDILLCPEDIDDEWPALFDDIPLVFAARFQDFVDQHAADGRFVAFLTQAQVDEAVAKLKADDDYDATERLCAWHYTMTYMHLYRQQFETPELRVKTNALVPIPQVFLF